MRFLIKIFTIFLFSLGVIFIKSQNSSFVYELNYKPNHEEEHIEKLVFFLDVKNSQSVFRSDRFRYSDSLRAAITWEDCQKLQRNLYNEPLAMISKSDVTSFDENGNVIKTNFKEMKEASQRRIRERNNPIELTNKLDFK